MGEEDKRGPQLIVPKVPSSVSLEEVHSSTTQLTEPVTFTGEVQRTQLTAPVIFTGTPSDLELIEACNVNGHLTKAPAGETSKYLDLDASEDEEDVGDVGDEKGDSAQEGLDVSASADDNPLVASSGEEATVEIPVEEPLAAVTPAVDDQKGGEDTTASPEDPLPIQDEETDALTDVAQMSEPYPLVDENAPPPTGGDTAQDPPKDSPKDETVISSEPESSGSRPGSRASVHFAEGTAPPAPDAPTHPSSKSKDKKSKKKDAKKDKLAKPKAVKAEKILEPVKPVELEKPKPAPEKSFKGKKDKKKEKGKGEDKGGKQKTNGSIVAAPSPPESSRQTAEEKSSPPVVSSEPTPPASDAECLSTPETSAAASEPEPSNPDATSTAEPEPVQPSEEVGCAPGPNPSSSEPKVVQEPDIVQGPGPVSPLDGSNPSEEVVEIEVASPESSNAELPADESSGSGSVVAGPSTSSPEEAPNNGPTPELDGNIKGEENSNPDPVAEANPEIVEIGKEDDPVVGLTEEILSHDVAIEAAPEVLESAKEEEENTAVVEESSTTDPVIPGENAQSPMDDSAGGKIGDLVVKIEEPVLEESVEAEEKISELPEATQQSPENQEPLGQEKGNETPAPGDNDPAVEEISAADSGPEPEIQGASISEDSPAESENESPVATEQLSPIPVEDSEVPKLIEHLEVTDSELPGPEPVVKEEAVERFTEEDQERSHPTPETATSGDSSERPDEITSGEPSSDPEECVDDAAKDSREAKSEETAPAPENPADDAVGDAEESKLEESVFSLEEPLVAVESEKPDEKGAAALVDEPSSTSEETPLVESTNTIEEMNCESIMPSAEPEELFAGAPTIGIESEAASTREETNPDETTKVQEADNPTIENSDLTAEDGKETELAVEETTAESDQPIIPSTLEIFDATIESQPPSSTDFHDVKVEEETAVAKVIPDSGPASESVEKIGSQEEIPNEGQASTESVDQEAEPEVESPSPTTDDVKQSDHVLGFTEAPREEVSGIEDVSQGNYEVNEVVLELVEEPKAVEEPGGDKVIESPPKIAEAVISEFLDEPKLDHGTVSVPEDNDEVLSSASDAAKENDNLVSGEEPKSSPVPIEPEYGVVSDSENESKNDDVAAGGEETGSSAEIIERVKEAAVDSPERVKDKDDTIAEEAFNNVPKMSDQEVEVILDPLEVSNQDQTPADAEPPAFTPDETEQLALDSPDEVAQDEALFSIDAAESPPAAVDEAEEIAPEAPEEANLDIAPTYDESHPSPVDPNATVEISVAVIAAGAIATVLASGQETHEESITEKAIVEEPEQLAPPLAQVPEESTPLYRAPSPRTEKRSSKHRSSRHSNRSSHHASNKEIALEEPQRLHSHRKRRESESSLKDSSMKDIKYFFSPPSPKTSRHDSGVSAGSASSHSKRQRTPEEQASHDKRKEERRTTKAKEAEADSPILEKNAPEIMSKAVPKRTSSRRHSSSRSNRSHGSKEEAENRAKVSDMKRGESVVETLIIGKDVPQVKEVVEKERYPVIDRPRLSVHGEGPKLDDRKNSSKRHPHSHRKERDEMERHRAEEEKEARRVRRDTDKQMEVARAEVAEEARRQREKDDEARRIRRGERRKRREAEDKDTHAAADVSKTTKGKEKERTLAQRKSSSKEKESGKGPLKSVWSFLKKEFA